MADWRVWRDTLAELVGTTVPKVWDDPQPQAFLELIWWGDIGGPYCIGPNTSAKLAQDFKDHRNQAEGVGGNFFEKYRALSGAFEACAKNGAVAFTGF